MTESKRAKKKKKKQKRDEKICQRSLKKFILKHLGVSSRQQVSIYELGVEALISCGEIDNSCLYLGFKNIVKYHRDFIYKDTGKENKKLSSSNIEVIGYTSPSVAQSIGIKAIKDKSVSKMAGYSHPKLGTKEYSDFYQSKEWREIRYVVLLQGKGRCSCCGVSAKDGAILHVDHIKPRSRYPELELVLDNLQVLCGLCNTSKGAWDCTDWR